MGRSAWAGAFLLVAWSLGVAACLRWAFEGASPVRLGAAAIAGLAAGGWALAAWLRAPRGELAWDGATWTWAAGDGTVITGSAQVALDLQARLLVRWRGEGATRWFWLERRTLPGRWDALRRAVYSRAESRSPEGAQPPPVRP